MQEPHHSLGLALANICRLHHARIHILLESVGLYRGQPPLLFALWHQDGQTHSELAERLHVTPATITRMIQRMEKTGFLERFRSQCTLCVRSLPPQRSPTQFRKNSPGEPAMSLPWFRIRFIRQMRPDSR